MNRGIKRKVLSGLMITMLTTATAFPVLADSTTDSDDTTTSSSSTMTPPDGDMTPPDGDMTPPDGDMTPPDGEEGGPGDMVFLSDEALEATYVLNQLGIISGDGSSFNETESLTRGEMVVMIIRMLGLEDEALDADYSSATYSDVPTTHWAFQYVEYASELGLVSGLGDGTFGIDDTVTENSLLTILIRCLDYSDDDGDFTYDDADTFAESLGWDVDVNDSSEILRGEAFYMMLQALETPSKDSSVEKGVSLDYFDEDGNVLASDGTTLTSDDIESGAQDIRENEMGDMSDMGQGGPGGPRDSDEDMADLDSGDVPDKPSGSGSDGGFDVDAGSSVETTGVVLVDDTDETMSDLDIESTETSESTIKVTNGGSLVLTDSTLNKSDGEMEVEEASDFFGANAGVLVEDASSLDMSNTSVTTSTDGGNGVFSTGEGTQVTLDGVTITTSANHSRGLDATYEGSITASDMTISTQGSQAAAVATDRGEGTVTVTDSTLNTEGNASPLVYSTGDISVSDSEGQATGAQIAVIEGKNSITFDNVDFSSYAYGRGTGDIDNSGVMIYQSMSGDADTGIGSFSATDSTLTTDEDSDSYDTAPMFFVTNTDASIYLENTDLIYGSDLLISIAGNDGEWGTEGSNGGDVTFTAEDQTLEGDIQVDDISSLDLTLTDSSYVGTINGDNTAESIYITLDEDSSIELTGDSYLTGIVDDDDDLSNIESNGYNLYYDEDDDTNAWLDGDTIELEGGGYLMPME